MLACSARRAFTLVEILVVIAILGLLAALLFPTFSLVREKARRASCQSNLKQIGAAMELYKADYDGRFPHAVDPSDKYDSTGGFFPNGFGALVPSLPLVQDVLRPYSSQAIFQCAGDAGFEFDERNNQRVAAFPSSYEKFGTSYFYRSELAALGAQDASLPDPVKLNVMFDASGLWHTTSLRRHELRYTILFADNHVKNSSNAEMDAAWATPAQ